MSESFIESIRQSGGGNEKTFKFCNLAAISGSNKVGRQSTGVYFMAITDYNATYVENPMVVSVGIRWEMVVSKFQVQFSHIRSGGGGWKYDTLYEYTPTLNTCSGNLNFIAKKVTGENLEILSYDFEATGTYLSAAYTVTNLGQKCAIRLVCADAGFLYSQVSYYLL